MIKDPKEIAKRFAQGALFTAVDTETTGLRPEQERLLEIGAVQFDCTGVQRTFSVLINPGKQIPAVITSITGITDELVSSCAPASEVLPPFLQFIASSIIIGHNIQFDAAFLCAELRRAGLPALANRTADTLLLSRAAYPQLGSHRLQALAAALAIPVYEAHRAADDARVCMELFLLCLQKLGLAPHGEAQQQLLL